MLYVIRHAHALDGADDARRPLSAKGRRQVERLAEFLAASGEFEPVEFWHSPLVRARETAELLASGVGSTARLVESAGLRPGDNPGIIAGRVLGLSRSVAVVGHDPHVTGLASLLVTGSTERSAFIMRKGAVLALEPSLGTAPGGWAVAWHVVPDLLE